MREEDEVLTMLPGRSLQTILFFSDRGKVYAEKAYQIPEAGRIAKGMLLSSVLALDTGEHITAASERFASHSSAVKSSPIRPATRAGSSMAAIASPTIRPIGPYERAGRKRS